MKLRKLLVIPALLGIFALGACAEEEEAGLGEGMEEGAVIETGGPFEEGVGEEAVGGAEILGNGIDDDGDGLIDEEA